jgi:hypothetical protein
MKTIDQLINEILSMQKFSKLIPLAGKVFDQEEIKLLFDGKMVGTFGDTATVSFYPSHHMAMWDFH